jgi:hypothetical protein
MDLSQDKPIIWITLINFGYLRFIKNFLESIKQNKVQFHLTVYCLDNETIKALENEPLVTCVDAKPFIKRQMNKVLTTWNTPDYKRIVFAKLDAIKYTMEKYKNSTVAYIDTDIFVFKDPTPIMMKAFQENPSAIIISQCDEPGLKCSNPMKCPNLCSGVIAFRQSSVTNSLLQYTEKDITVHLTDQHFLTAILQKTNIPYYTIDKNILLNGAYPRLKEINCKPIIPQEAVLLHYNYMIGMEKERCMQKNGMWLIGA